MKSKISLSLIVGLSVLFAANLNAQVRPGAFSISPNIGSYIYDEDNNALTYGAGLGYDFTEQIGIEGTYNRIDKENIGNTDLEGYFARLDALVYFRPGKKFTPYIAFGVGNLNLERSGGKSDSDTAGNYGLGMKYFFNDYIAFRADVRHVMPKNGNDLLATAGLSFNFGGKKKQVVEEMPAQAAPPKDSDGDGVADNMDQCPNTPAGTKVDSKGCPLDSDVDGVTDNNDQCPNTPAGTKVDSKGCPLDSDGDGVTDDKDQCPNTPAGTKVDSKGCPLDSDGDGVTDDKDQCPNTPSGTKVDSKGCPLDSDRDGITDNNDQCPNTPEGATVDSRGCWILKNLKFDTNKADIKADGARILDDVAGVLEKNASVNVEIDGHTDSVGAEKYNQKLSEKRAKAVMDYLVRKGIAQGRLSAKGFGEGKPAASNDTEEGRAENRRVELTPVQ